VDAVTADGRVVRIRPVLSDDGPQLTALYERAGADALYRPFFSPGRGGIPAEVARLTRPPAGDHVTLVVAENDRLIGAPSYAVESPSTAEFAVFVDDAAHGHGLGTLSLEHLVVRARRAGIAELVGQMRDGSVPTVPVWVDSPRAAAAARPVPGRTGGATAI
jgi:GNAT superfamily N-acetyltransferase